jgi:hypothetical protein
VGLRHTALRLVLEDAPLAWSLSHLLFNGEASLENRKVVYVIGFRRGAKDR